MPSRVDTLNEALAGRYRIERELGEGGMATVYLADDLRHGRKVALKVLKPDLAAAVGATRFLSEIRTTAKLQHPHIVPLFDSGEAGGFLFYAMPWIEGESLRQRLDRLGPLPVDEAIRVAAEVAEALDYAHRNGVIHRDIKPENVYVQDGHPRIADFGIALAVARGSGERLTETGVSIGTPTYMSPEQATGDHRVGPATDIYALGCLLYEMLVGEPPFTASTPQAILAKVLPQAILAKVLDLETGEYEVVTDGFAPALTDDGRLVFARGGGLMAAPFDPTTRALGEAVPLVDSIRVLPLLLAHAAVSGNGTLVYAAPRSTEVGRMVWVDRSGDWRAIDDSTRMLRHPRLSQDQRSIVFDTPQGILLRDIVRGTEDRITQGGRAIWMDRTHVTFSLGISGRLFTVATSGGEPTIIREHSEPLFALDWSTDGRHLAYSEAHPVTSRNVWTVGPDSVARPFVDTPADERSAGFSPDNRWIAYSVIETGRPSRDRIGLLPTDSGQTTTSPTMARPS